MPVFRIYYGRFLRSVPICQIKIVRIGHKLSKNGQDIPFETFLGFDDGDKVPDIDLNFSGEDQPSAHLMSEIFLVRNMPFVLAWLVQSCQTAYGFVKGYERDTILP